MARAPRTGDETGLTKDEFETTVAEVLAEAVDWALGVSQESEVVSLPRSKPKPAHHQRPRIAARPGRLLRPARRRPIALQGLGC